MIPRHVRIKKLPAKHKQSQVSEALGQCVWGGGAAGRDSGQQQGGGAAQREATKPAGLL